MIDQNFKKNNQRNLLDETEAEKLRLIAEWLLSNRWHTVTDNKDLIASFSEKIELDLTFFSKLTKNKDGKTIPKFREIIKENELHDEQETELKTILKTHKIQSAQRKLFKPKMDTFDKVDWWASNAVKWICRGLEGILVSIGSFCLFLPPIALFAYTILRHYHSDNLFFIIISFGLALFILSIMVSFIWYYPNYQDRVILFLGVLFFFVAGIFFIKLLFSGVYPSSTELLYSKNQSSLYSLYFSVGSISAIFFLFTVTGYWLSLVKKFLKGIHYLS